MKILVAFIAVILTLMVTTATSSALPKLCGMSASYRAVYEYPTGSYWVKQINKFPTYYAVNDAYFQEKYGC